MRRSQPEPMVPAPMIAASIAAALVLNMVFFIESGSGLLFEIEAGDDQTVEGCAAELGQGEPLWDALRSNGRASAERRQPCIA